MAARTMGVKLDEETRARLEQLGKLRQRSAHWLMKKAIERYLDCEEAFEREKQQDMARWEEYQLTGEHLSHEEMTAWLDDLEVKDRS